MLVLAGTAIQHLAAGSQAGPHEIVLARTLLGLSRYTGPAGAQIIDRRLESAVMAVTDGSLLHVLAVLYGNPVGRGFTVTGGTPWRHLQFPVGPPGC